MSTQRTRKVAQLLKEEICRIIREEIEDPRIDFVTVTRVEVSKDLKHAVVLISVFGDEKKQSDSIKAINQAKGFVKKIIGDVLLLRFVPDIIFKLDKSTEYSVYIDKKIDQIRYEDEQQ